MVFFTKKLDFSNGRMAKKLSENNGKKHKKSYTCFKMRKVIAVQRLFRFSKAVVAAKDADTYTKMPVFRCRYFYTIFAYFCERPNASHSALSAISLATLSQFRYNTGT